MRCLTALLAALSLSTPAYTSMVPVPDDPTNVALTPSYLNQLNDDDLHALYSQLSNDIQVREVQNEKNLLKEFSDCMESAEKYDRGSRIMQWSGKGTSTAVSITLGQLASYAGIPPYVNYIMSGFNAAGLGLQAGSVKAGNVANDDRKRAREIQIGLQQAKLAKKVEPANELTIVPAPNERVHRALRAARAMPTLRKNIQPQEELVPVDDKTNNPKAMILRNQQLAANSGLSKAARQDLALDNIDQLAHAWKLRNYETLDQTITYYRRAAYFFRTTGQLLSGLSTLALTLATAITTSNVDGSVTIPRVATYVIAGVNAFAVLCLHMADMMTEMQHSLEKKRHKKEAADNENLIRVRDEWKRRMQLRAAVTAEDPPLLSSSSDAVADPSKKHKEEIAAAVTPPVVTPPQDQPKKSSATKKKVKKKVGAGHTDTPSKPNPSYQADGARVAEEKKE